MKSKKKKLNPNEIFAKDLAPFVAEFGAKLCANLCGVSTRCVELWLKGTQNPNQCTKVGVMFILKEHKNNTTNINAQR